MTHKLYEYEYFKNVLEYMSTEYFHLRSAFEFSFDFILAKHNPYWCLYRILYFFK